MPGEGTLLGQVGPYGLRARLGGRPGVETYLGTRAITGQAVAVDRIDPRLTARRPDLERITEALTCASLVRHPTLVRSLELAAAPDAHYWVREWCGGHSLAALLDAVESHGRGRLPLWLSLHLAAEVLTALTVVHAEGRAHGALDADVVRVTDRGDVKVDGAMVYVALDLSQPMLSPEGAASTQADLFAVGVLLYRALTSRRPFEGGSYPATRALLRSAERVAPSAYEPSLPRSVDSLVLRLLSTDPELRPPGALRALAEVLAAAGDQTPRTPEDVRQAFHALVGAQDPLPPARVVAPRRVVSHAGRALPLGAPSYEPVPIVARQDMQWDHVTGEFELMYTPPRPSVPAALEAEPLLYLTLADGRIERAENLAHLAHVWRSASARPRLVARTRTSWLDADRFAALAGIEGLAEEGATLRAVTHVGDLANTSLLALLAELARARATGSLMIMDPVEPRTSRRTIRLVEGAIASVDSSHPGHQLPELLAAGGLLDSQELGALFRDVIRLGRPLLELVAERRRLPPERLWARVWTERLGDPLCTRRGRYAFDASPVSREVPTAAPSAAGLLIEAARRAKTPEELRQWAASRRVSYYAVASDFEPWTRALALDERLGTLSRELSRHHTIDETVRRTPGDAGAIFLLAYLFSETRALVFSG